MEGYDLGGKTALVTGVEHPLPHATAAVLACGLPRALAASWIGRGMVVLGRYSYALYLVHFPVLVRGGPRSSVVVAQNRHGAWKPVSFGAVSLMNALERARTAVDRQRALSAAHDSLIG